MISISGIKYQKELESLPFFDKNTAEILIDKKGRNLDKKIDQLIRIGYLKIIKKGLYVTDSYYSNIEKGSYTEYIGNILRQPSYISLEYVLSIYGLIPESVFSITSITVKSTRKYINFLGNFIYKNLNIKLFCGFTEKDWQGKTIYIATKAKALFDYFYLRKLKNIKTDVFDVRIDWDEFSKNDLKEFETYVSLSQSKKMKAVLIAIKNYYANF